MARLLLDENLPRRLRTNFAPHTAATVQQMRWSGVRNGALLRRAQQEFDVFVTADRSIPFQQSVAGLDIGVVVIETKSIRYADILPVVPMVMEAVINITAGQVIVVSHRPH